MKRAFLQPPQVTCFFILLVLIGLQHPGALAAPPKRDDAKFFEQQVRPVLAEHCLACHGPEKQRGGLRLDSRAAMLEGGESGPAIEPGQPDQSLLIEAIRWESYEMPPAGKLPDSQIAAIASWVRAGSPWPGDTEQIRPTAGHGARITHEDRQYWAFQPVVDPPLPKMEDTAWGRNEIDRFILRKLELEHLEPASEADPAALVRRVYFDLTGLPPSSEALDSYLADPALDAYERLVDRLLDSSQYGERWARHWLDLVRYAESDGFRQDAYRPHAWRYRDYVVRAFNEDKPYDRFIFEQLAGDELDPHDLDCLAATSYLRHWVYEYNQRDVRTQWDNILTDITNVTSDVFLGLGMGCARCHDHKFDPILQEDYFRLKAFFAPLLPTDDLPYATAEQWDEHQRKQAEWDAATSQVREQIACLERPHVDEAIRRAAEKFPPDIRPMIRKPQEQRSPFEHQLAEMAWRQAKAEVAKINFGSKLQGEQRAEWQELQKQLAEFDDLKPSSLPPAFTVTDVGPNAPPTTIPKSRDGRDIPPGFLTVLDPAEAVIDRVAPNTTGRRTALARWLTSPENPLTSRVIVNRIWQQHFGRGLVSTASDFGHLGEPPTHPELLDWLTSRFVEDGWRLKPLHRRIMTSAAYRQSASAVVSQMALQKDPENRWLWRMNIHRLDAEQIRDAMLAASGELERSAGGASVDYTYPRRSIYCKVIRNTRDPVLDAFDVADGFSSTDQRNVTTTPIQSLMMINSPWPLARSRALAARLQKLNLPDEKAIVVQAYRWAYGRSPDSAEMAAAVQFLQNAAMRLESPSERPKVVVDAMPGLNAIAADFSPGGDQERLILPENDSLPAENFTIEAVIYLRALYPDATVRTIVSHWDSNNGHPGWALGVTSTKSAYQPRNLILQMVGDPANGGTGYEVVASNLRPELNKPYYVAASVKIADTSDRGITFYIKDLSQADAELQTASVAHKATAHYRSPQALVVGGRDRSNSHQWDGLIGDIRLSAAALEGDELSIVDDMTGRSTIGFWRFDDEVNRLADRSSCENHLVTVDGVTSDPGTTALADFCHVLLNSSEFLYVD